MCLIYVVFEIDYLIYLKFFGDCDIGVIYFDINNEIDIYKNMWLNFLF